jgi:hypothetical protein
MDLAIPNIWLFRRSGKKQIMAGTQLNNTYDMSIFLNCCTTFLFLSPISLANTQSCIQVWCQVFLFGKAEEKAFDRN